MRSGHKPRDESAIETGEVPAGLQPVAANDQPGIQLPLDSLEEPAEILVRVSTDELEADSEPVAESVAAGPPVATTIGLFAEPSSYEPAEPVPAEDASLQMRLARIHLRTGSLAMARAQLESLAGRELLDTAGTLDLAEARWRTGDLHGAGEAAVAYLAANGGEALGFVIAAEAEALGGRRAEARRYMDQAELRVMTSLDSVFAGIPRKAKSTPTGWGTAAVAEMAPEAEWPEPAALASQPAEPPAAVEPVPAPEPAAGAAEAEVIEEAAALEPGPASTQVVPEIADTATTEPSAPDGAARPAVAPGPIQADAEIAAGAALLRTGDPLLAALHFGIALRMTPESAASVLSAVGDRRDLALELVRGDALRMLGRESDAGQAYLSVASALSAARAAAEPPAESPAESPAEPPAATGAPAATQAPATTQAPESPAAASAEPPAATIPPEPPTINQSD